METFMGCGVGELRLEVLKSCIESPRHAAHYVKYQELLRLGYLQSVPAKDCKYAGYALTEKGKKHVKRLEDFYAAAFWGGKVVGNES